jgi:ribonuclease HI
MKKIVIYTDGCSLGNPGPGGSGVVVLDEHEESVILKSGHGVKETTNNERELYAVYMACRYIDESSSKLQSVVIKTDSQYVVNSVTKGWAKNWVNTNQVHRPNYDLWVDVLDYLNKFQSMRGIDLKFVWVKGHAGTKWNELADQIAKSYAYEYK